MCTNSFMLCCTRGMHGPGPRLMPIFQRFRLTGVKDVIYLAGLTKQNEFFEMVMKKIANQVEAIK